MDDERLRQGRTAHASADFLLAEYWHAHDKYKHLFALWGITAGRGQTVEADAEFHQSGDAAIAAHSAAQKACRSLCEYLAAHLSGVDRKALVDFTTADMDNRKELNVALENIRLGLLTAGAKMRKDSERPARSGEIVKAGYLGANLFESIAPHRHLPAETRQALWTACELVRTDTGAFANAVAWLDHGYSEAAVRGRNLKESELMCRLNLREVRHGPDRCDTFPRRMALRAGKSKLARPQRLARLVKFYSVRELLNVSDEFIEDLSEHPEKVRDWVVQLTISTAQARGMKLRGGQIIISDDRREGDAMVDVGNVETAWLSMDDKCRQQIRRIMDERRERDTRIRHDAKDRMGRLLEAVRHAVKGDIPVVNRVESSRRLVLLAAMIAAPEPLSLSAEFGAMPWATQGNILGMGGPYVLGRETFFEKYEFLKGATQWSVAGFMADGFGNLIARAVNVVFASDVSRERVADVFDKAAPVAGVPMQPLALVARSETEVAVDAGGPVEDPHDARKAVWAGKKIYLGNDTEVSRLFWLLAKSVGRAASLAKVQRAIDGMETDRDGRPDDVRKAGQRMRKVISKLRAAIREAGLDDHVLIAKGGSQADPEYTMVWRFAT